MPRGLRLTFSGSLMQYPGPGTFWPQIYGSTTPALPTSFSFVTGPALWLPVYISSCPRVVHRMLGGPVGTAGVGHGPWLDIDARLPSNHIGAVSVKRRICCKHSCNHCVTLSYFLVSARMFVCMCVHACVCACLCVCPCMCVCVCRWEVSLPHPSFFSCERALNFCLPWWRCWPASEPSDFLMAHLSHWKLQCCRAVPGEDDHSPAAGRGLEEAWHGGRGKAVQKSRRFFIWKCEIMG